MKSAFAIFALLCALAGCVQKPTPQNTPDITNMVIEPPSPVANVDIAHQPPVDLAETLPPAPGPEAGWAWQRGYWRWSGMSYVWTGGKWARRPNYGAEWLAPHWDHQAHGGWTFTEGYWR